ncbi:MAG: hypothetical protein Q4C87_06980 [Actinomycetaceae bacterium]|nr:hypothetical protein [Actinomycetaceae bacterium]
MAGRVLASPEAQSSIATMQGIIDGGLGDQIAKLDAEGNKLSDPNVWDGPLAERFRSSTWPDTSGALKKVQQELLELRAYLEQVQREIMAAGGGS